MGDSRYRVADTLAERLDRGITLGQDRWTGRTVILKTGEVKAIRREARCLLELPSGVAPRILDLYRTKKGRLTLVLEQLDGVTLHDVIPDLSAQQIPLVILAICRSLAHVHQAGWIHADLKPENIFLIGGPEKTDLRLLDFGFAISRFNPSGDENESGDEDKRGGTPPYLAPEILKGWIVDDRADLYSLGVILTKLLESHGEDQRWKPILEMLLNDIPAYRFADASELAATVIEAFDITSPPEDRPLWGGGPLRGREKILDRVVEHLRNTGRNVVIQARPRTGLTRFLLETALKMSEDDGPPITIVDLPSLRSGTGDRPALDFLESPADTDRLILCGVDDPSPGFRWLENRHGDLLRRLTRGSEWERFDLPMLDRESIREIVVTSLGAPGPQADILAETLGEKSEGDLQCASHGFFHCTRNGVREGRKWQFESPALEDMCGMWRPTPVGPEPHRVSAFLFIPLSICARAGWSFSESLASDLLARFYRRESLAKIRSHGYLIDDGDQRLRFVTKYLWRNVQGSSLPNVSDIDLWLNEAYQPDPDRVDEVLQACQIARRVGDTEKQRTWISEGLVRAETTRRWSAIRRLLAYPNKPPTSWNEDWILKQVTSIADLLGDDWSVSRVTALAGIAISPVDHKTGDLLLERAVAGSDPEARATALPWILDRLVGRKEDPAIDKYLDALRETDGDLKETYDGLVSYFLARRSIAGRDLEAARSHAETADKALRGTGVMQEAVNRQVLAILQFSDDPDRAISTLKSAFDAASDPETVAQIGINLSLACERSGRFPEAQETVGRALRLGGETLSSARVVGLRIRGAWVSAYLDQLRDADDAARALIRSARVRMAARHLHPVRLLLGYCRLFEDPGDSALREICGALDELLKSDPIELRAEVIRHLIDAVIDLEKYDSPLLRPEQVAVPLPDHDRAMVTTHARARALVAQIEGKPESAEEILRVQLDAARSLDSWLPRARYLHHLAVVLLSPDLQASRPEAAAEAADLLDQEIEMLPKTGAGYVGANARMMLSKAHWIQGNKESAIDVIKAAAGQALEIGAKRVRSRCLNILADYLTD